MNRDHVAWALAKLSQRRAMYDLYLGYYEGQHRLAFATQRVRDAFGDLFRAFALNLCATVVDSLADRLQVVGFSGPGAGADGAAPSVQRVWERNLMGYRHGVIHRQALAAGDAYALVWQDGQNVVRIWDEDPRQVVGHPDPNAPGELDFAVKVWVEGKRVRVTVYYRDRIERYISTSETTTTPPAERLRPLEQGDVPEGADGQAVVVNPWDVVPVFHWANNPGPDGLGVSFLRDVVPPQDALNKSVADLLATMEAHSLPLRFLIGVEPEVDADGRTKPMFQESRDRVVALGKGASVHESPPANPSPLLEIKDAFANDVSDVSGIPRHLLRGVAGAEWPSGDALRLAESRLVTKGNRTIGAWGPQWAACMGLANRMAQGGQVEVRTLWGPVGTPPSDEDAARTAYAKQQAGIPPEQTWREMGYSEAQVAQFSTSLAEREAAKAAAEAAAFNAGDPLTTGGLG